ncbi:hypothetical protein PIB30_055238 [Stylosanthes scabra]|uniref:Uncharacterized protein n=1 Tax=Stylosanthes scabra TaxID=79078 RepID=A0ABU6VH63_9FABA|nr:hypothetical protein [Stylosanthes scabra]
MKDRLRSGPDDWSLGKYNRWLSGASSGSVGLGYDNRPDIVLVSSRIERVITLSSTGSDLS